MSLVIGLTGSIATGKSTVASMIKDMNIPVIDADELSREVVEPGEAAYQQIKETFGEGVFQTDGFLDRKALGRIIFNDEEKRKQLNDIVHPAVRERMLEKRDDYVEQGTRAVVLDIPLLFESGLSHYVDRTLVVAVDEDTQLKRLMERDESTREEALSRINAQIPISEKAEMADAAIDNSDTKEQTLQQLQSILWYWDAWEGTE
ncbi:dephospho-CoA kinase [Pontibacillus halophilus JSM 076056 = DSM 19796]|uniref:Dephospho-CoA kinase n=1 Tax=Pontibacillus halophilus JSM 076056 = DSM 19796 TaxID=1385510 RepID=A0A0A5GQ75_9BACI|nr:dephospho-CoA kinase [Pontibacillus halophilus]KGX93393.1 dephospho-CoA kinase [Pontibacillus halophilus JSM 076056 = DSM 19796]